MSFTILREDIRRALNKKDIKRCADLLGQWDLKSAIEVLSVNANLEQLNKNTDFKFLIGLYGLLNSLEFNDNSKFHYVVKVFKTVFSREELNGYWSAQGLDISEKNKILNQFIDKTVNKVIANLASVNKLDSFSDLYKIKSKFGLPDIKLVKWFSKIIKSSKDLNALDEVDKMSLFNEVRHKKYLVNYLVNNLMDPVKLDIVYKKFGELIHDLYYQNLENKKIWGCLEPKRVVNYFALPSGDEWEVKKSWFNKIGIGYKKHEIPYEILDIYAKFSYLKAVNDVKISNRFAQLLEDIGQDAEKMYLLNEVFTDTGKVDLLRRGLLIVEKQESVTLTGDEGAIADVFKNKDFYELCKGKVATDNLVKLVEAGEEKKPRRTSKL